MAEVSVITVCMNRPDILFPCLDSIRLRNTVELEVLVVAYNFSPENLAALKAGYPWVKVVESRGTMGFSENNNLALRQAQGRYCFIVNDDTLMDMPVIDLLVARLESLGPEAAAISPKIVFADGRVQTCGRAPWTLWRYMKHYLHLVDETRPSKWSMKEGLFQTYTLNGACFLIKTDAFREVGFFDERFFFTPEDIALGHKLNESGHTVWVDADVTIKHLAGGSVSKMEPAIKPARVKGALLFYGRRWLLGSFIWCFEALRALRYIGRKDSINYRTARNVMRCVFSSDTPKQVFEKYA